VISFEHTARETHERNMAKDLGLCTKCHKEKAEWLGIGDDDLCQECWESYCSAEWWRLNVWQNGARE